MCKFADFARTIVCEIVDVIDKYCGSDGWFHTLVQPRQLTMMTSAALSKGLQWRFRGHFCGRLKNVYPNGMVYGIKRDRMKQEKYL
ncbi:hypothetical protein CEXT_629391 [Caerostris extrusa]|uniref:Uncharacterized protein n=1 Tax=Caerostris extrusa TaxID=172846 RepID=A0AAV4TTQ9_CAEEX|nr:hypothetical protein CEXT_629391 [Caerostris extrusa]